MSTKQPSQRNYLSRKEISLLSLDFRMMAGGKLKLLGRMEEVDWFLAIISKIVKRLEQVVVVLRIRKSDLEDLV